MADQKQKGEDLANAEKQVKPTSDALADAQKNLGDKQKAANDALDKYGQNSPQYQKAAQELADAQTNVALKMNDSAKATLSVRDAKLALTLANQKALDATNNLKDVQLALTKGLNGTVDVIKNFGPAAANQINDVDNLSAHVQKLMDKSNAINNTIQPALKNEEIALQGLGSTMDKLQNQAQTLPISYRRRLSGYNKVNQAPAHNLG